MNKIIIFLVSTLLLGCSHGHQEPVKTHTPATPDITNDLSDAPHSLLISSPLGEPAIRKKTKNEDSITKLYRGIAYKYGSREIFCSLLGCGETVNYTPKLFKEEYSEFESV
ncbi:MULTISPECIES: hypothetical protein, partial [unclassified Gilliamella]|uniref:hypothetical protein n=1 Tax=unclassified Gilliamella TaxID=2685620 RepID=UPI00136679B7